MLFTETHEWIKLEDGLATIGITEFALEQLGEVVFLSLPEIHSKITQGEELCVLESTKAATEIYAPISGVIEQVNLQLEKDLTLFTKENIQSKAWLVKMKPLRIKEMEKLLEKIPYQKLIYS